MKCVTVEYFDDFFWNYSNELLENRKKNLFSEFIVSLKPEKRAPWHVF